MLRIIKSEDPFVQELQQLGKIEGEEVLPLVEEIIDNIKARGNSALIEYTKKFDGASFAEEDLKVDQAEIEEAYAKVTDGFLESLRAAIDKIYAFHQNQLQKSWWTMDGDGSLVGQMYLPLSRVGLYVPGGTAAYPSSVLMTAIPGLVAGVSELVMVSPPDKEGKINPYTLVAAAEVGISEIYKIGGAQAIAALSYGTQTIEKTDKIVGPGNIYVTMAKKVCYGDVGIDMLAGPSEILIVADDTANPVYLAADLLSQAEHDVLARAILVTPNEALAVETAAQIEKQLELLPRREIALKSLKERGAIIITSDLEEGIAIANFFAPEHLELALAEPISWLGKIKNAGAVFLGHYTPESLGDYYAGPSHVLPTGGTARFSSPLNVDMYLKKTSIISYTKEGLLKASRAVEELARIEGLHAHGLSIKVRK